jgi:diaminopimelate epimerase
MLKFYKYHGTGNDFIIFDGIKNTIPEFKKNTIELLCDRRFGIGADGLMILKKHNNLDFEMEYFNADGSGATMCGNGGRCMVALAFKLGYVNNKVNFSSSDGHHQAEVFDNDIIHLKLNDVESVHFEDNIYSCYTGSPHVLYFVDKVDKINVFEQGRTIRYSYKYLKTGTNVNFIEVIQYAKLKVRTYERGVEDETYSCGTGSVASAVTYAEINKIQSGEIEVNVKGGQLSVCLQKSGNQYVNIWLKGPAKFVYEGFIRLDDSLSKL